MATSSLSGHHNFDCKKAAPFPIELPSAIYRNTNNLKDDEGKITKYRSYEGFVVSSDAAFDISKLMPPAFTPMPLAWAKTSLPLTLLPLGFLTQHVQEVSRQFATLASQVSAVEEEVINLSIDQTDFRNLIARLHLCKANIVKLHDRWHFQQTLAAIICELIELHKPDRSLPRTAKSIEKAKRTTSGKEYHALERAAAAQQSLVQHIKYDIEALPKRISNQSTAVRRHWHCTDDTAPNC